MQLKFNIKPYVMEAGTKQALQSRISRNWRSTSYKFSSIGSSLATNDKRILVNYEKYRSKRGVREAHWKAYVYIIPEDLLKSMNLRVDQKARNFEIKSAK